MKTLDTEEVLNIHQHLVDSFANSDDPLHPSGIRDDGALLGSAITRQTTGYGGILKYPTVELNAATLCFGICNNHCFHNGNKRTALVALLCHLDKNELTFVESVRQDMLYDLMVKVAAHKLIIRPRKTKQLHDSDAEVEALGLWIKRHTRKIEKGERVITYRELDTIIRKFGYYLDNPRNNHIGIYKDVVVEIGFIFKKTKIEKHRVCNIPYPRDGAQVARHVIKLVRESCGLIEAKGIDSKNFYTGRTDIDYFINRYKKTLRRLAKT